MPFILDAYTEQDQAKRNNNGGKDDDRNSHLGFKDTLVPLGKAVAQKVIEVATKECAQVDTDESPQTCKSLGASLKVVDFCKRDWLQ